MQTQSSSKEREFKNTVSEITDKTMKNYQQALQTGFKVQEEAMRCWNSLINKTPGK